MTHENLLRTRTWKLAGGAFTALISAAPGFINLYNAPAPPQKHVAEYPPNPTNILHQLSNLANNIDIKVSQNGQSIANIVLLSSTLKNDGNVPIPEVDYASGSGLAFTVDRPWRIIKVANIPNQLSNPPWKKVSEQSYEAPPQLFNVGDQLGVNIYLTNPNVDEPSDAEMQNIGFRWVMHVNGLPGVSILNNEHLRDLANGLWGPLVAIYGWGLVCFTLLTYSFFSLYLLLFPEAGLTRNISRRRGIAYTLGAATISAAAAESISTLLIPSLYYSIFAPSLLYNIPPIIINAIALFWLFWRASSDRSRYDIFVASPIPASRVSLPFRMEGSLGQLPPPGWELRLFTTNAETNLFWPQAFKAIVTGHSWQIDFDRPGAAPDASILLQLFMVGPRGVAFIQRWRDGCLKANDWTGLPILPPECVLCTEVISYIKQA